MSANEDMVAEASLAQEDSQVPSHVDVDSALSVERWLAARIAERLQVTVAEIDVKQPLSCFAIDSVAALELLEELEVSLEYVVSPSIFYQQPATIRALSERLVTGRRRSLERERQGVFA